MQFNYQELIEDDPVIQNLLAERELKGEARGKAKGLQESILKILNVRFPALAATPQARQAVASIYDLKKLDTLFQTLLAVSDEQVASMVLQLPAQGDLLC